MTPSVIPCRPSAPALLLALAALALLAAGCFPPAQHAGPRLAHFPQTAPAPGTEAPDFELLTAEGETVRLSEVVGEKPVVLQVGSHTCPVYRYRSRGMRELHEDYAERARFLVVYTGEAHPVGSKSPYTEGEWNPWINRVAGVRLEDPASYEARRERAGFSKTALERQVTFAVDRMDDAVWKRYGAAPSPAFVIDRDGRIALSQVWVDPDGIRRALDGLLAGEKPATRGGMMDATADGR